MRAFFTFVTVAQAVTLASSATAIAQSNVYKITGTCDGLPRIDVGTPPGVCVGLVTEGLRFPRSLTQLKNGNFVVVDMGGWAENNGSLWILSKNGDGKTWSRKKIIDKVDRPHGSALGPDGLVYVGEISEVFRFDPNNPNPASTMKTVVAALPTNGRHPLTALVFDRDGALFVNRGSASDNCETGPGMLPDPNKPCAEAEGPEARGVIRKYVLNGPNGTAGKHSIFARGLRNSMSMAIHPTSGLFVQGENARDAIDNVDKAIDDKLEPHEEINIIEENGHYGWPYCYNSDTASPEFPKATCSKFKKPTLLLPAHVAPLGMTYYSGKMFPEWYQGKLLVTYHGYREFGQKLVAIPTDANGRITGEPLEIINNWSKKNSQPLGAPVGVTVAADGSIWLTEDKNGTVLRVFFDGTGDGIPTAGLTVSGGVEPGSEARCKDMATRQSLFTTVEKNIIDPLCVRCHGASAGNAGSLRLLRCDDIGNAQRLLAAREGGKPAFVIPKDLNSELYLRGVGKTDGLPPMPAGGLSQEHLDHYKAWIMDGAQVPVGTKSGAGKGTSRVKTVLKRAPLLSDDPKLLATDKCSMDPSRTIAFSSREPAANAHIKLNITSPTAQCKEFVGPVYVWGPHFNFE